MSYQIIDFHAHIYPEKIAQKASQTIGEFYDIPMRYSGSPEELITSGNKINVEKYIVHSTATKPQQVESINNFIIGECEKYSQFIGFGTIHPDYENFEKELEKIKNAGLKGIKLHPDFQLFQIDTEKMDPIYKKMAELKLPVLVHAGDYRYDYSGPKRIARVLEKHPNLVLIAAHFGGYSEWEESVKHLVGKNVYFDTSSTLWKLPLEEANKILKEHGIEKFLFGVDFPMWDHFEELERFNKLDLDEKSKQAILYDNAKKLLEI